MAFTAVFYKFGKKENSTERPVNGDTVNCILKDNCSMMAPVLKIDIGLTQTPDAWNYCYIPEFDRYYYINDWFFSERLWNAELKEDVLASWKDSIGASNLYVLRSEQSYDGYVYDTMYPTTAEVEIDYNSIDSPWTTDITEGTYIVGIIGNSPSSVGAVEYYAMSHTKFRTFMNFLLGDASWNYTGSITDEISENLYKSLFNPFQYVVSCIWLPFSVIGKSTDTIHFGWWEAKLSGIFLLNSDPVHTANGSIAIPKHPQAAERGNYLNLTPYSQYYLYFMPWGVIPIDATDIVDLKSLSFIHKVDEITGVGILQILNGIRLIGQVKTQVGITIQLAQLTQNFAAIGGAIENAGSALLSAGMGNIGGMVSGTMAAIGDVASSQIPKLSTSGGNGFFAGVSGGVILYGKFFTVVDEDNEHNGRPLCKKRTINTLSGYIIVRDGDVAITGTADENSQIRSYLESGFYYE